MLNTLLIKHHKSFLLLFFYNQLTACGTHAIHPWQKQDLARPEMTFESNSVSTSFEEHFYFSKEGSSGGKGFSGGGCGCN